MAIYLGIFLFFHVMMLYVLVTKCWLLQLNMLNILIWAIHIAHISIDVYGLELGLNGLIMVPNIYIAI